ncbi:MAG: CtkA family protein [Longicatena sp.]
MNKTKTKIFNLNECEISDRNGMYGGMAGSKEGILLDNEYWIVKYPKSTKVMNVNDLSYTTSPLSEYIGSHVYEILGYDVHKTILGERNNKIVVGCKDFCKSAGDLRELRTLKNIYNEQLEQLLEVELDETSSSHLVDLKELLIHLDNNPVLSAVPELKTRFWDCVVIDGFIKNNDRNNGNWGLLYEDKKFKISPIFDNGACLSPKLNDNKISEILSDEDKFLNSSLNVLTAYGLNGHQLNLNKMFELSNPELDQAVLRVYPKILEKIDEIASMINSIPNKYKNLTVCSDERKMFYIKGMQARLENTLETEYKNIVFSKDINKMKSSIKEQK